MQSAMALFRVAIVDVSQKKCRDGRVLECGVSYVTSNNNKGDGHHNGGH